MHALLFLIEKLSFSDVVDNNELTVLAVKDHGMRGHLNIDYLFVFGLMPPGAGNDWLLAIQCVLNNQCGYLLPRSNIMDCHREKLFPGISVRASSSFVYRQKSQGFFVVHPDWLWR